MRRSRDERKQHAGILPVLAVGVLNQSSLLPGMQILGTEEGFPALPSTSIELLRRDHDVSSAANRLAHHLIEQLTEAE